MAVNFLQSYSGGVAGEVIYFILSTDTKPSGSEGYSAFEMDTKKLFRYESGVWVEKGTSSGDVVGPAVSVNNRVVFFDGTTGKLIKDSGLTLSGSNTGDQTISDATISTTDITTNDVSITKHGFAPKAPNDTTKFLRGDGTWAAPGAGEAFPVGAIFIAVVSTNPNTLLGYGTWSAIGAGRVLIGVDSSDTDFDTVEETGGSKTVSSSGSNSSESSHTHSVTSNVVVADHSSHTHTYTDIVNHTHPVTDPGHNHTQNSHSHVLTELRDATTGGATTNIAVTTDTTSTLGTKTTGSTTATNNSATTGITTNNPSEGIATGTTAGPSAVLSHGVTNNTVTSGVGSSHTHTFTGSATSVVQPYLTAYFWKRTA